jgi:hypothetical protein
MGAAPQFHLRGKARWRKRRVFLYALLIMVFYVEIGRLKCLAAVAAHVPFLGKSLALAALVAVLWYVGWRIQRRVLQPTLPELENGWVFLLGFFACVFAVVTADSRTFFSGCTFLMILSMCALERYYWRKLDRAKERGTQ